MLRTHRQCQECNRARPAKAYANARRKICDACRPGDRLTPEEKLLPPWEQAKARSRNNYRATHPKPNDPPVASPMFPPTRFCIYCKRDRPHRLFYDDTHDKCDVCALPSPLPDGIFDGLDAMQHRDLQLRSYQAARYRLEGNREVEHARELETRRDKHRAKATRKIIPRDSKSKRILKLPEAKPVHRPHWIEPKPGPEPKPNDPETPP